MSVGTDSTRDLTRVARGGGINLAGSMIGGVLSFVLVLLITNAFPAADAGAFFALSSLFLILLAAVELGANTGLVKWLPHHLVYHRYAELRSCLRIALVPVLIVSTLVAVVVALVARPLADLISSDGSDPAVVDAVRVLACLLPVAAAYDVLLAATRGFDRIRPTVLVERVGRVSAQPLAVAVAVIAGGGLVGLTLAWALPYAGALLAAGWFLLRLLRHVESRGDGRGAGVAARPARAVAGEFWRYTWARGVSRILQVALQRADIVIVAALRSPREAAIYTAATRLVSLGVLGVQAVQQVTQPVLSRLLAVGDITSADRIFRTSTIWVMALSWPPFLAAAALAPQVLSVFGEDYQSGSTALVVVCLVMLVGTGTGPTDVVLLMAGRSSLSLAYTAVALTINLSLNVVLVPQYGITGAAVAFAAAIVAGNGLTVIQVHRGLHMNATSQGAAWVAAASATCFGVLPWAATQLITTLSLIQAMPVLAACTVLYAGILWYARQHIEVDVLASALRSRGAREAALAEQPALPPTD